MITTGSRSAAPDGCGPGVARRLSVRGSGAKSFGDRDGPQGLRPRRRRRRAASPCSAPTAPASPPRCAAVVGLEQPDAGQVLVEVARTLTALTGRTLAGARMRRRWSSSRSTWSAAGPRWTTSAPARSDGCGCRESFSSALFPPALREEAMGCLERVGLADRAHDRVQRRSPAASSSASRIARALCQRARVLLADEPVSALDPAAAEQVMALLRRARPRARASPSPPCCTSPTSPVATPTGWSACSDGRDRPFDARPRGTSRPPTSRRRSYAPVGDPPCPDGPDLEHDAAAAAHDRPPARRPPVRRGRTRRRPPASGSVIAAVVGRRPRLRLAWTPSSPSARWSRAGAGWPASSARPSRPTWPGTTVVKPGICAPPDHPLDRPARARRFSIPFALRAGRPRIPDHRRNAGGLPGCARSLMSFLRAVPDVVFALIFVTAVGLGPFPGVLALIVHNTGVMGKLWSEAMEETDHGPAEALRIAGAGRRPDRLARGAAGRLPQLVGLLLYRFDVNVRASLVLGLVGAGGIGFLINQSIQLFRFDADVHLHPHRAGDDHRGRPDQHRRPPSPGRLAILSFLRAGGCGRRR